MSVLAPSPKQQRGFRQSPIERNPRQFGADGSAPSCVPDFRLLGGRALRLLWALPPAVLRAVSEYSTGAPSFFDEGGRGGGWGWSRTRLDIQLDRNKQCQGREACLASHGIMVLRVLNEEAFSKDEPLHLHRWLDSIQQHCVERTGKFESRRVLMAKRIRPDSTSGPLLFATQ